MPLTMASSESRGGGGTIDLPIIYISDMNYGTGKQVLEAFVSLLACFTELLSGHPSMVPTTSEVLSLTFKPPTDV